MKRVQQWKQEKGTYYAVNKQRKLTYRRIDDGPWEQVEALSRAAMAEITSVGWEKIDNGWFAVYRGA